jgi:adenylate kinase
MLRAVLIAPPGAGKGTQGDQLAAAYGVPHISLGEILRTHVARGTPTGLMIAATLETGELVQDAIVTKALFDQLAETAGGFILDGFPRTLAQAIEAERWTVAAGLPLHAAIELQVPREELVSRLTRRSAHSSRSDDTQETILHRLDVYDRESRDLLDYYRQEGILITVDGSGQVGAVTQRISARLDQVLDRTTQDLEPEAVPTDRAME